MELKFSLSTKENLCKNYLTLDINDKKLYIL